ncbi:MAG: hypothetical protein IID46_04015 [Planctomycetes bacterium]|nr:hypothetical protein [Planctomycetota bacterium]
MTTTFYSHVDLIKELRLRRWARTHYVTKSERSDSWDSIVLNEMSKRDLERDLEAFEQVLLSDFVPLEPIDIRRFHSPHQLPEEPKVFRTKKPVEHYVIG